MIPREILKKIRQIELRTNRIVIATPAYGCFGRSEAANAGEEPVFDGFCPIFTVRPEIYSYGSASRRNGMDCKNRGNTSRNNRSGCKNSDRASRNRENDSRNNEIASRNRLVACRNKGNTFNNMRVTFGNNRNASKNRGNASGIGGFAILFRECCQGVCKQTLFP
jgi:hypothetical protein